MLLVTGGNSHDSEMSLTNYRTGEIKKMCTYLQNKKPDALKKRTVWFNIGYSILNLSQPSDTVIPGRRKVHMPF